MSMTDPVADLLTRIRNGSKARKPAVDVPASNVKRELVRILKETYFVRDYIDLPDNKQGILRVYLRYSRGDVPVIRGLQRLSSPGLRKYVDAEAVRLSTRFTQGISIISTSQGMMTNHDAAKRGVGGELMVRCW
ncbi:MAG TPA: 30S ribosomal protein S8 [Candidatus Acidoferrum sp.]|nr:30S ribosomal protein S8 [Candidatus Acidoferrum sp.]